MKETQRRNPPLAQFVLKSMWKDLPTPGCLRQKIKSGWCLAIVRWCYAIFTWFCINENQFYVFEKRRIGVCFKRCQWRIRDRLSVRRLWGSVQFNIVHLVRLFWWICNLYYNQKNNATRLLCWIYIANNFDLERQDENHIRKIGLSQIRGKILRGSPNFHQQSNQIQLHSYNL